MSRRVLVVEALGAGRPVDPRAALLQKVAAREAHSGGPTLSRPLRAPRRRTLALALASGSAVLSACAHYSPLPLAEQPVLAPAQPIGAAFTVSPCDCNSQIGSGALPLDTIASGGLVIRSGQGARTLERLATALRSLEWPVIGRMGDGGLILDLRCLTNEAAFLASLSGLGPAP